MLRDGEDPVGEAARHTSLPGSDSNGNPGTDRDAIDLQTASKQILMQLHGVGDKKAIRVIEYRVNNRITREVMCKLTSMPAGHLADLINDGHVVEPDQEDLQPLAWSEPDQEDPRHVSPYPTDRGGTPLDSPEHSPISSRSSPRGRRKDSANTDLKDIIRLLIDAQSQNHEKAIQVQRELHAEQLRATDSYNSQARQERYSSQQELHQALANLSIENKQSMGIMRDIMVNTQEASKEHAASRREIMAAVIPKEDTAPKTLLRDTGAWIGSMTEKINSSAPGGVVKTRYVEGAIRRTGLQAGQIPDTQKAPTRPRADFGNDGEDLRLFGDVCKKSQSRWPDDTPYKLKSQQAAAQARSKISPSPISYDPYYSLAGRQQDQFGDPVRHRGGSPSVPDQPVTAGVPICTR